jgi:hypothetical protein
MDTKPVSYEKHTKRAIDLATSMPLVNLSLLKVVASIPCQICLAAQSLIQIVYKLLN